MPTTDQYESAMSRALELSLQGPFTGVNPQVGAVILDAQGESVAEGWHLGTGTDHAEVMAIKNLKANLGVDTLPSGFTAVVTLEPCNHTGKTGPCAKALIEAGIARVVFASSDPGEASSSGAKTLGSAGVEVVAGVLLKQAEAQNRVWLTSNRLGRPFVTLKWASSLDGRNAAQDGSSKWISGEESRADTHVRRSQADAIMVGTATIEADNPELTAREVNGALYDSQPLRVIVGKRDLDRNLKIFSSDAETVQLKTHSIEEALDTLWDRGIKHVFVEGGPNLASEFVKLRFVDEYLIYLAPMVLGGDKTSLIDIGVEGISEAKNLEILETKKLGNDIFIRARSA
jgi:diaminohydroxyphosphoribosylaminopyrimidine deaminase/5-amino-6-(5-phosphoribosylamino)uracil reductase